MSDKVTELNAEIEKLTTEYIALCKRQDEIKKRISELSMQAYEIEYPDMQTEYVPPELQS